jgi:hypothetical protein
VSLNVTRNSFGDWPSLSRKKVRVYVVPGVVARSWERGPSDPSGPAMAAHWPPWPLPVVTPVKAVLPERV